MSNAKKFFDNFIHIFIFCVNKADINTNKRPHNLPLILRIYREQNFVFLLVFVLIIVIQLYMFKAMFLFYVLMHIKILYIQFILLIS